MFCNQIEKFGFNVYKEKNYFLFIQYIQPSPTVYIVVIA